MSSRERISAALSHKEADRVPFDFGGIGPTGISFPAFQKLLDHLQIDEPAEIDDIGFQRAKLTESFLERFRVDTRQLKCPPPSRWKLTIQEEKDCFFYFDEWGIGRKMNKIGGEYYFMFHYPLAEVETGNLSRFPWPDPTDLKRLEEIVDTARRLREGPDPATVLGGTFSLGLLQFAAQLEGTERFFSDLALDPYRVEWILDKLLELKITFYLWALERLAGWVDVVMMGDDFGHQTSQWISPEMFRRIIKPRYSELLTAIKKRFEVRILLHSDGAIYTLIPDIIEMGFDALNPIQTGAREMGDTRRLKREFGDAITLWGGGVDVQQFLPYATPQEVEDEVMRRIEDLAPGGGFVFAATQAIQSETPSENVMAMWRALQRYGIYPIQNRRESEINKKGRVF
jgi:uroporphyrinogen decarboxylase